MSKNLDNYRKLKPNEFIRAEDVYVTKGKLSNPFPVKNSIGSTPGNSYYYNWDFYRRRHTKKQPATLTPSMAEQLSFNTGTCETKHPNVLIVSFYYHGFNRWVQVIKIDGSYLKGLEITFNRNGQKKYQFKSFLLKNILNHNITIESYGPAQ